MPGFRELSYGQYISLIFSLYGLINQNWPIQKEKNKEKCKGTYARSPASRPISDAPACVFVLVPRNWRPRPQHSLFSFPSSAG